MVFPIEVGICKTVRVKYKNPNLQQHNPLVYVVKSILPPPPMGLWSGKNPLDFLTGLGVWLQERELD
jgi:hypothetical protein